MVRDNRGSALAITLVVFMVLAILGVAFVSMAASENKFAIVEEKRLKAYYIARSGADAAAEAIINGSIPAGNLPATFEGSVGDGGFIADVSAPSPVDGSIDITSRVDSVEYYENINRTVTLKLAKQEGSEIFNDVLLLNSMDPDYFDPSNHDSLLYYINQNKLLINGGMVQTAYESDYTGYPVEYDPALSFPQYATPGGLIGMSDINATGSTDVVIGPPGPGVSGYSFFNISVNGSADLVFETGGQVLDVVVGNLYVKNEIRINTDLNGNGALRLFIGASADFQTPSDFNFDGGVPHPERFILFLPGGDSCSITANGSLAAYIYGPSANILLKGATIFGSVVANEVNVQGSASILNYTGSGVPDLGDVIESYVRYRWGG